MKWDGSVAVITGASRGIGRATAIAAAKRGARVGLVARAKNELEDVLDACGGTGAIAVADVGERREIEDALASLERELGTADILVNNAGIGSYGSVNDTDAETFERLMRVNYFGTMYATKAVLPGMLERARGHIVNVASIAGHIGAPNEASYCATKFAMVAFTESLHFEMAGKGVGVSMIHPGPVATSFFDARGVPFRRSFPKPSKPEVVARAIVSAVEKGRYEQFSPHWLRFPVVMRALFPPMYRKGALRSARHELR